MELTRILDTLRDGDGNPAEGRLIIHNAAFIAADGTAVVTGAVAYSIPASSPGLVDMRLVPTEGADPADASYTVEYFLKSGATYQETWHLPRTGPITISQARQ
jgi:hypothetical protein